MRDASGGEKVWSWIKKGVPIRLEVGQRELENNAVFVGPPRPTALGAFFSQSRGRVCGKRLAPSSTTSSTPCSTEPAAFGISIPTALTQRPTCTTSSPPTSVTSRRSTPALPSATGTVQPEVEETIKNDLNVTIRCIPLDAPGRGRRVCDKRTSQQAAGHSCQGVLAPPGSGVGRLF